MRCGTIALRLRKVIGTVMLLASSALWADTLLIATSGEGPVYDEVVQVVRAQLSDIPDLKIEAWRQDSASLPPATTAVLAVGVQATRELADLAPPSLPVLGVMVPRAAFHALPAALRQRLSILYMDQPARRQINLVRTVLPDARTLGLVSGPTTQHDLPLYRTLSEQAGLTLVSEHATRDSELYPALQAVLRSADVLLALPDPFVINGATAQNLLLTSFRFRVPVMGYSSAYVRAGALAAVYTTPAQMGREAALSVRQMLGGNDQPQTRYPRMFSVSINRQLAENLNLRVPDEGEAARRMRLMEPQE